MKKIAGSFPPVAAFLWLALWIAPAANGQSAPADPGTWDDVRREAAALNRPDLADRLRTVGFEPGAARALLGRVTEARTNDRPAALLLSRLDEGLAKGAPAGAIVRAVGARADALAQSARLLDANDYKDAAAAPRDDLLSAVAVALESGLPPDAADAVLKKGQGQYAYRMISVIEAGESLTLAGIGAKTARDLMIDCLDRNLGRMEILRAARFAIEQHRQGVADSDLRQALWKGVPSTGGGHGRGGPGGGNGGHGRGGPGR